MSVKQGQLQGFGFIEPETGSRDVFVHISAVERSGLTGLADNPKISSDVRAGWDGREKAEDLRLV
ncbi:cold-shock protein [Jannaschia seohaensis]|uniref:cold-shock protein n=1 Tax=Jannaschia seohaensis TaxID=475081 RepID=UPI000D6B61D2|nr:cold shock domain-containing protein [Jannaschia seohaensis]